MTDALPPEIQKTVDLLKSLEGDPAAQRRVVFAMQQSAAKWALDHLEKFDDKTVAAWFAWTEARNNKLPVPSWVLDHVDAVADRFCQLADENADFGVDTNARMAAWATEFDGTGQGTKHAQFQSATRRIHVATEIGNAIRKYGWSVQRACTEAAMRLEERGIGTFSPNTVRKWYEESERKSAD